MSRVKKVAVRAGVIILLLAACFLGWVWLVTYHPAAVEDVPVQCAEGAPTLKPGQPLKVLSWNVQYMASKRYVFFYDKLDGSGPDERPSPDAIAWTLKEVARVIKAEDPDVILLQEVDRGAKRTDYEDQTALLLALLPKDTWRCVAQTPYWKADFVPHPRIMGAVGLELVTLSKYKLNRATRHALPMFQQDPLTDQFYIKRALLSAEAPVEGGATISLMNTHLDAFAQGTDTMARQVKAVMQLTDAATADKKQWVVGGDFNLLPPGPSYERLPPDQRAYFNPSGSEIKPMFDAGYTAVPSLDLVNGPDYKRALTHIPNDPKDSPLDRPIDYLFFPPNTALTDPHVRQHDTTTISDHVPVVATFTVATPAGARGADK